MSLQSKGKIDKNKNTLHKLCDWCNSWNKLHKIDLSGKKKNSPHI